MCDKIEAIESQLEEAINAINEINNDQIDSYHYILTSLEQVSKELLDIKENYVAIEAVKPILDAIKDLTNEVNSLKREMKPVTFGCCDSGKTEKPKTYTYTQNENLKSASTAPIDSSKTTCGDPIGTVSNDTYHTTWADIIRTTYGNNKIYIDDAGTHYTIRKIPEDITKVKFIF